MKVVGKLKGVGIIGYSVLEDELKVFYDVYSIVVQFGFQKVLYIVQFLWWDLIFGFDLIGLYFFIESLMMLSVLQEFIMLCFKVFISYGFKVFIFLCDGVFLYLIVLKFFFGSLRVQFFVNVDVEILREWYKVEVLFIILEDLYRNLVFFMICRSYQVLENVIN